MPILEKTFKQAFADGFDIVLFQLFDVEVGLQLVGEFQIADCREGEVGVDGGSAETDEAGEMVYFPDVAGFHDDADLAAVSFADEVVVDGGAGQQRRNGCVVGVNGAVGKDQHFKTVFHGVYCVPAEPVQAGLHGTWFAIGAEIGLECFCLENAGIDAADFFELMVAQNGMFKRHGVTGQRVFSQQIGVAADEAGEGHDQSFPDGVDGRVGDLGEQLFEIAAQVLWLVAEYGQRNIGPHRADGFLTVEAHRGDEVIEVFGGITEGLLIFEDLVVFEMGESDAGFGQLFQPDLVFVEPFGVGLLGADLCFQLVVADDAFLFQVHDKHFPGLEAAFFLDQAGVDGQDAGFGGHDDPVILCHAIAGRPQAVAVERGADDLPVREGDRSGAVPGFHDGRMEFVKCFFYRVHLIVPVPGFGDQHHHHVRQGAAAERKQFDDIIETGAVGCSFGDNGKEHVHLFLAEIGGSETFFAGPEPVEVALQRIDLTVMSDIPKRLGQFPGREGIGGEPGMDEAKSGYHAFVAEVREIVADLGAG